MDKLRRILLLLFIHITSAAWSQTDKEAAAYSMNEGTMAGLGAAHVKDTYLSPFDYNGWGFRILNERMKIISRGNGNISRQQFINVDISSTRNPAENINDFGGFVDYSLGFHYRFNLSPNFRILAGGAGHLMGGFLYNTRNGNNPFSAKADIDLNLSAMMMYHTRIKDLPLTFRYQIEMPVTGVFFAPDYGESYYEIFNVGNVRHTIRFNSFHNKFAFKNYFTVDIPCRGFTLRAGFLNSIYHTDEQDIQTRIVTNTFLIGWVKEFIVIGGKRQKRKPTFNSSFY
ncbi:MAG: DUF3316 domain-containing protein [Tannerellaceae bacterium]|nr:DUF3316 domain-containing protein [Tannerellaceae bacterium]